MHHDGACVDIFLLHYLYDGEKIISLRSIFYSLIILIIDFSLYFLMSRLLADILLLHVISFIFL